MNSINKAELIAPCGMNCGVCDKYLAYSHQIPRKRGRICYCSGCRPNNKMCSFIKKRCPTGNIHRVKYCYECNAFPCELLTGASSKYRERYGYDFVDALRQIQAKGVDWFVREQDRIHRCPACGDAVCIHNKKCYTCNREELK